MLTEIKKYCFTCDNCKQEEIVEAVIAPVAPEGWAHREDGRHFCTSCTPDLRWQEKCLQKLKTS